LKLHVPKCFDEPLIATAHKTNDYIARCRGFQKAYAELQEDMIAELQSERNRQRLALLETAKAKRGSGSVTTEVSSASTAAGGRSLRSSAPVNGDSQDGPTMPSTNTYGREYAYGRLAGSNKDGAGANGVGANGTAGSTTGSTRKRSSASQGLDYTLPESTMR
jgi:hypothetical protein